MGVPELGLFWYIEVIEYIEVLYNIGVKSQWVFMASRAGVTTPVPYLRGLLESVKYGFQILR